MVDLPHPDGPSSDRKVPRSVLSVALSSATTLFRPIANVLLRPEMCSPVPRAVGPPATAGEVFNVVGPFNCATGLFQQFGMFLVDLIEEGEVE